MQQFSDIFQIKHLFFSCQLSFEKTIMFLNFQISIFILTIFSVNFCNVFCYKANLVNDAKISESIWKIFLQENILPHPKIKNCFVNFCSKDIKGSTDNIQILKMFNDENFRSKLII